MRISFGSNGRQFGCTTKTLQKSTEYLSIVSKRFSSVVIEQKNYDNLIKVYDRPKAFFYLDPPYSKGEGYEVCSTKDFEHEKLAETLKNIKGKFLLSYDDSKLIRKLYKGFDIIEISRHKGINNYCPKGREYKELLIKNY